MAVPYTFGSATTSIPLSQLDSNFATTITLGNTAVQLGNTITTLTGVTNLASSGALTLGSNGNTTAITVSTSQAVSVGTTNVGGTLNTATTSGNWGEIIFDNANNASMLAFRNNAGAAAGNISLSSAGSTSLLMSSVAGVNFPATQVASSDANTLDDYEEGTWTPTDVSGAGLSYTISFAQYTKIGKVVTVTYQITFPSTASGASARIGGLPFTNATPNVPCATLSSNANAQKGITYDTFIYMFALNSVTSATNSQLSTSTIYGQATYLTST